MIFDFLFSFLLHKIVNVICRAAVVAAVKRILFLVKLRKRALNICGGGTEQSRGPHPKTAPAPPIEMAATTPTRFPIPTLVAVETISV